MEQAANFYTRNMAAMRLRELQTWTEIARERNMIVVTGGQGDSKDLGALLGITRERTPTTKQLDEDTLRTIVKQELINLTALGGNTENGGSSNKRPPKGERNEDQEVA
jgi:hypothetical protein